MWTVHGSVLNLLQYVLLWTVHDSVNDESKLSVRYRCAEKLSLLFNLDRV